MGFNIFFYDKVTCIINLCVKVRFIIIFLEEMVKKNYFLELFEVWDILDMF